ncbi:MULTISPECIES: septum site-determining protein MinD [Desulfosediminicola]|uniref:septum site-determining protein MinD n=1 Tax=Desulfosediminicola TaxID=2886823 RepID=UPI001E5C4227|nr:septum site-determining protein MinD [Desulfosediminicola ganghwensis]
MEDTIQPLNEKRPLGQVVVVTSGKGGVGKTTTSAAFAAGLAVRGYKTVVIDFDVGLRNLDLIMGCERRVVYDLLNVIHGEGSLHQALIKDKRIANLSILPASQTRDKDALTLEGVGEVIDALRQKFDYIICDSPAGIEKGAMTAMYYADVALVVANPEISSVRDSDRMIGILASKSRRAEQDLEPIKEHLIITRYDPSRVNKGEMLSADDVNQILAIPFLGVVPESEYVLNASNSGVPVTLADTNDAGDAYFDVIDRFLGKDHPFRFMDEEKKSFLSRLFGT